MRCGAEALQAVPGNRVRLALTAGASNEYSPRACVQTLVVHGSPFSPNLLSAGRMILGRIFALAVIVASCTGCQVWQQADEPISALNLIEPAEDQVVLDISFVTVTASNEQLQQTVWNATDQQVLDNDLRRRLAANGMRCGILGQSAPEALEQLLLETKDAHEADLANGTGSLENVGDRGQQMQLRTGRLGKVVVTPGLRDEMVILSRQGDQFVGETLTKAQCLFGIRCYPESDQRVTLELSPQIEHGEAKTRFVGKHEHASWLVDSSRERRTFTDLTLRPALTTGQTFVVSCTPEMMGVGGKFFGGTGEESTKTTTMLLVRVVESGASSIFSPASNRSAIVPTEG